MTEEPQKPSNTTLGPGESAPKQPDPGRVAEDFWPRRVRLWLEGAWREAAHLGQTVLDSLVLPSGGFSAVAFCWLTSALVLALSLPAIAVIGLGALVLFAGLECLALLAYAFPGALFLSSLAGGVAPPVIAYWALHALLGIEGDWTSWGAFPLLMAGLFGAYYYWRFGRAIVATGEGALAFYRRSAPRASELFAAPFAILSTLWKILARGLVVARGIARQLLALVLGTLPDSVVRRGAEPPEAERRDEERDETG